MLRILFTSYLYSATLYALQVVGKSSLFRLAGLKETLNIDLRFDLGSLRSLQRRLYRYMTYFTSLSGPTSCVRTTTTKRRKRRSRRARGRGAIRTKVRARRRRASPPRAACHRPPRQTLHPRRPRSEPIYTTNTQDTYVLYV